MVTGSSVSKAAHNTCIASFLAPCGTITPLSLLPPVTLNDAMTYCFLLGRFGLTCFACGWLLFFFLPFFFFCCCCC